MLKFIENKIEIPLYTYSIWKTIVTNRLKNTEMSKSEA